MLHQKQQLSASGRCRQQQTHSAITSRQQPLAASITRRCSSSVGSSRGQQHCLQAANSSMAEAQTSAIKNQASPLSAQPSTLSQRPHQSSHLRSPALSQPVLTMDSIARATSPQVSCVCVLCSALVALQAEMQKELVCTRHPCAHTVGHHSSSSNTLPHTHQPCITATLHAHHVFLHTRVAAASCCCPLIPCASVDAAPPPIPCASVDAPPPPPAAQGQESGGVRKPYRVAYQGVPGAYSEMAACKACPDAEPVPCEQFEVAFQVGVCV